MTKNTEMRFPVFADDKGNRFVFPSIYEDADRSIDFWQCMTLRLSLGVEQEPDHLVVPIENGEMLLRHVRSELLHRSFAHGAATVFLLSGPTFDEIVAETETEAA